MKKSNIGFIDSRDEVTYKNNNVKELLNEVEKEVIRDLLKTNVENKKVKFVRFISRDEKIYVNIETNGDFSFSFSYTTLFKNVEVNKQYALKELGLEE